MKKLTLFVSLILCLAMMFALASCSSKSKAHSSPESVVQNCLEAYSKFDADGMFDSFNEGVLQRIADEEYDGDFDACKEAFKEYVDELKEEFEGIELSFKVIEIKDLEGDDLDEVKEFFSEYYDAEVSAAASVTFEMTVKGEDEGVALDNTEEETITVIKIDGKWYVNHEDITL